MPTISTQQKAAQAGQTPLSTHSPLPWRLYIPELEGVKFIPGIVPVSGRGDVAVFNSEFESSIGITGRTADEACANAAFIVRACNSHNQLVAALKAIIARIDGVYDSPELMAFGNLSTSESNDCARIAESTLRQATI